VNPVTERPWSGWLFFALLPLYVLAAIVLLEALVVGSWSDQAVAAWLLLFGALGLGGMATAAVVAARAGRVIRRWILGYVGVLAATLTLVVVSWMVTNALNKT
jgi:hypothetical protein